MSFLELNVVFYIKMEIVAGESSLFKIEYSA